MKEQIGEKIRRLRKEKGLTQDNVHHNQSQVALIEKGKKLGGIANPTEDTLRIIAVNMDMTFDELIDETTWKKSESTLKNKEIAFSPVIVDVGIDDNGNITWSHKSYPLYNEKGEKNEYCPESGRKLIDKCGKCERQVENLKQQYCIGCGSALFSQFSLPKSLTELLSDRHTFDDYEGCNEVIGLLGQDADSYRNILEKLRMIQKIEDYDLNLKMLLQSPFYFQLSDSIKFHVMTAIDEKKEIPEQVFEEIHFYIQVIETTQKKLKSIIINLDPPKEFDSIDKIKTELYRKVAFRIYQMLDPVNNKLEETLGVDPVTNLSFKTLIELLNELRTTKVSDELIEKLQSKINPKVKTEDDSDYEKISEDGNSETAAAENAERNNKNAENQNEKRSKNE